MLIRTKEKWIKALFEQVEKNSDDGLPFFMSARSHNNKIGKWYKIYRHNLSDVGDYREILPNEIVFDIDVLDWDEVKKYYKIITKGLSKLGIPFIPAKSGGKGIHIHIFFDMNESVISEVISKKDVKKFLAYMILSYSGLWSNEVKNIIDIRKISSNPHSSLIRDFGGKKYYAKTMINNDHELIKRNTEELCFPDGIRVWEVKNTEGIFFKNIDYISGWWSKRIQDEISVNFKGSCDKCEIILTTKYSFPSDQCILCRWIRGNKKTPSGYYIDKYEIFKDTSVRKYGETKDIYRCDYLNGSNIHEGGV